MSDIFCGIDVGTTNLKVLLMDEAGETLWVKSVPAPHLNDGLGVVTDAMALLAACEDLIIMGWRAAGQGRRIGAIASAGIGEDGVCISPAFLPLGHAIQWNDRRGEADAAALAATDLAKDYPAILLDFSSTAGKWAWMARHRPAEQNAAAAWITMTDWPIAFWSQTAFISSTLAPRTGCFDVFTRQWLPGFLDYCHAPSLPKMIEAGGIVGRMRQGRLTACGAADTNTLLAAGGHDHPVAASVIRRMERDARIDSMGTANATYGETTTLEPQHDLAGLYVTLPITGAKGAAVIGMTEFSKTLTDVVPDLSALYATLCSSADLPATVVPTLTTLAERTKDYWSAMSRAGVPDAPIYATGGWSKCPGLMQLRADVFDAAITVVDEPELVALGAAHFAASAAGAKPAIAQAKHCHVVEPRR